MVCFNESLQSELLFRLWHLWSVNTPGGGQLSFEQDCPSVQLSCHHKHPLNRQSRPSPSPAPQEEPKSSGTAVSRRHNALPALFTFIHFLSFFYLMWPLEPWSKKKPLKRKKDKYKSDVNGSGGYHQWCFPYNQFVRKTSGRDSRWESVNSYKQIPIRVNKWVNVYVYLSVPPRFIAYKCVCIRRSMYTLS